MKREFEKIMNIFDKYGLESIRADLLFDEDIHSYYNFFTNERVRFYNTLQRDLTQKEESILKRYSMVRLFLYKAKIPNLDEAGLSSNQKIWNEYYPFYHLLFQPNSLASVHMILNYSVGKYLAELEGYEHHLEDFEIALDDKVKSFEVIIASLDERGMLIDFKEEFDKDPMLALILAKFLKRNKTSKKNE